MPAFYSKLSLAGSTLPLIVAMLAACPTAHAALSPLTTGGNAANFCQSALPVFDVQIRKRPLSVQNEGATSAFVTCVFNAPSLATSLVVFAHSNNPTATTLRCTAVLGVNDGQAKFSIKDIPLAANGAQNKVPWRPEDFGGTPGGYFEGGGQLGISCNLAPGMGIDQSTIGYDNEIGN